MSILRRQRILLCWLVIVAMVGSAIARLHCWAPYFDSLAMGGSALAVADHSHCDRSAGHAGDHKSSHNDVPAPKLAAHCPVCMALAAVVLSEPDKLGSEQFLPPEMIAGWSLDSDFHHRAIRLGGLGSRAPPLLFEHSAVAFNLA